MNQIIRDKLIAAGVKNLKEYGYPDCNKESLLADCIYSRFFLSMLEENKGHSKAIDTEIDALIKEIEAKP